MDNNEILRIILFLICIFNSSKPNGAFGKSSQDTGREP